ncbi:MAG TPA: GNAT family N-acetyltransferase [Candidatus Eisenbacteria bacterium]
MKPERVAGGTVPEAEALARAAGISIRPMTLEDVPDVTLLTGQLGYPSSEEQVRFRFQTLRTLGHGDVFVAVSDPGGVVGWIYVALQVTIEGGPGTEVWGLVVDESCRGRGIGRALMARAEEWARARGFREVSLRTNILRKETHRFYQSIGYEITKTQYKMKKRLE